MANDSRVLRKRTFRPKPRRVAVEHQAGHRLEEYPRARPRIDRQRHTGPQHRANGNRRTYTTFFHDMVLRVFFVIYIGAHYTINTLHSPRTLKKLMPMRSLKRIVVTYPITRKHPVFVNVIHRICRSVIRLYRHRRIQHEIARTWHLPVLYGCGYEHIAQRMSHEPLRAVRVELVTPLAL